jgi:hypothetical protein
MASFNVLLPILLSLFFALKCDSKIITFLSEKERQLEREQSRKEAKKQRTDTKIRQRRLREITLQEAIEQSFTLILHQ